ncbi:MAG: hypothetical protein GY811_04955 [Myxococcales bacterium]|nr:hypothetical protein [Myxococcales bacterium]
MVGFGSESQEGTKWRVEEDDHKESTHPLSAQQFDEVWEKVDSTGWRHLEEDCNNNAAAPKERDCPKVYAAGAFNVCGPRTVRGLGRCG